MKSKIQNIFAAISPHNFFAGFVMEILCLTQSTNSGGLANGAILTPNSRLVLNVAAEFFEVRELTVRKNFYQKVDSLISSIF